MRAVNRGWTAALSAAALTVGLSVGMATPAGAVGGPCGQNGGSSGSSGSSGSAGSSGSLGSLSSGSLGSATGSLMNSLPWITGAPNGALPVLTGKTKAIEMVTGPGSSSDSINRFSVSGTDLGIMWDNDKPGNEHGVMMLFGDTVGACGVGGDQWRSNVLFRSADTTLTDGMKIDSSPLASRGFSKQVIQGLLSTEPGGWPEFTVIPTGGVAVDGKQYVRWMSVRSWDTPGEWTTNYSGLAVSADNGETWQTDPQTVRVNRTDAFPTPIDGVPAFSSSNENWQMSAFVPDRGDGFVYELGTPSGRSGAAHLARVPANPTAMVTPGEYRYWDGSGWSTNIAAAVPVIESPVSELSVQWNEYLQKYIGMYSDVGGLKIRQSSDLVHWSGSQTLIGSATLPGLYGGFMHPWSTGKDLYFVLTTWDRYNVIYMRTDLTNMKMAAADMVDRPDPADTGEQRLEGFNTPEGFTETVDGE
ncbi:DUF4185 domain-containing protein [Prescottella agglutinans]|uniref:DUF4185 domain-containing protein n=1 Tax=Prescottella agglutinans TaxID=1644129 RepID=UPI001F4DCDB0|nr:DUF4185 domain-containing protein [Prescottella agglutinans]